MLAQAQRAKRLYKTILRLHRGLPKELQLLGDSYAREEFKKHKKCGPDEAKIFMSEWSVYAVTLSEQVGLKGPHTAKSLGLELSESDLDRFRDEQVQQLYELKLAATEKPSHKPE